MCIEKLWTLLEDKLNSLGSNLSLQLSVEFTWRQYCVSCCSLHGSNLGFRFCSCLFLYSVRSSEVKVGIDEFLDVAVSVENREENSYNSRVTLTYPVGLSYRTFTVQQVKHQDQVCFSFDCDQLLPQDIHVICFTTGKNWMQLLGQWKWHHTRKDRLHDWQTDFQEQL